MKRVMFMKKHLVLIVVSIFCLVLVIIGIVIQINNSNYLKTALTTDAVITRIDSERTGDTESYDVYITYNVNNVEYDGVLGLYYTGMHTGQIIQIYYDPENPSDCRDIHTDYKGLMLIGFAILFEGVVFVIQKYS